MRENNVNTLGKIRILPHFLISERKNQFVMIEITVITEVKSIF